MGKGADASPYPRGGSSLKRSKSLLERLQDLQSGGRVAGLKDDLLVLRTIWFKKTSGDDHAQRLEQFYSPQAHACEGEYPPAGAP